MCNLLLSVQSPKEGEPITAFLERAKPSKTDGSRVAWISVLACFTFPGIIDRASLTTQANAIANRTQVSSGQERSAGSDGTADVCIAECERIKNKLVDGQSQTPRHLFPILRDNARLHVTMFELRVSSLPIARLLFAAQSSPSSTGCHP